MRQSPCSFLVLIIIASDEERMTVLIFAQINFLTCWRCFPEQLIQYVRISFFPHWEQQLGMKQLHGL